MFWGAQKKWLGQITTFWQHILHLYPAFRRQQDTRLRNSSRICPSNIHTRRVPELQRCGHARINNCTQNLVSGLIHLSKKRATVCLCFFISTCWYDDWVKKMKLFFWDTVYKWSLKTSNPRQIVDQQYMVHYLFPSLGSLFCSRSLESIAMHAYCSITWKASSSEHAARFIHHCPHNIDHS